MNLQARNPLSKGIVMYKEENAKNIIGMGDNVVKFIESQTDDVICYLGKKEDKDVVFFHKPVPPETIVAISQVLSKKKMRKAIEKGNYGKAQKLVDKML